MSISPSTTAATSGLATLEERLRDDFVTLGWPAKAWIPPSTRKGLPVHDVLVIGAGMSGTLTAYTLHKDGVDFAPRDGLFQRVKSHVAGHVVPLSRCCLCRGLRRRSVFWSGPVGDRPAAS